MKTITVSKGEKDAMVDDDDFDRLCEHRWFLDQKHIYTKLSFDSGKTVGASTFHLKVRMDYFIYNYSPHINARIKHKDGDLYNCQRDNLRVQIKDPGNSQIKRTIYLGVVEMPQRVRTNDPNARQRYLQTSAGNETYAGEGHIQDYSSSMDELAESYDRHTRYKLGDEARANFLLPVRPHKYTGVSNNNGENNEREIT